MWLGVYVPIGPSYIHKKLIETLEQHKLSFVYWEENGYLQAVLLKCILEANGKVVETYFIFKFMNDVFIANNDEKKWREWDACQSGMHACTDTAVPK